MNERRIVDVSPKQLTSLYRQHASQNADELFLAFRGKQIHTSVTVWAVSRSTMRAIGMSAVSVYGHDNDGIALVMEFPAEHDRAVESAKNGDILVVLGTIAAVMVSLRGGLAVLVVDCDVSPTEATAQ